MTNTYLSFKHTSKIQRIESFPADTVQNSYLWRKKSQLVLLHTPDGVLLQDPSHRPQTSSLLFTDRWANYVSPFSRRSTSFSELRSSCLRCWLKIVVSYFSKNASNLFSQIGGFPSGARLPWRWASNRRHSWQLSFSLLEPVGSICNRDREFRGSRLDRQAQAHRNLSTWSQSKSLRITWPRYSRPSAWLVSRPANGTYSSHWSKQ